MSLDRSDVDLRHWVRSDKEPDTRFQFNVSVDLVSWTKEEYQKNLSVAEWTISQTEYLFECLKRHDCRFPVIMDRWDEQLGGKRTMEDAKERYLYVTQKMLKRTLNDFDKDREKMRKQHLSRLWSRTQEDIDNEDKLYLELQSFESQLIPIMRDRQELLSRFYKGLNPFELANHNKKRCLMIEQDKTMDAPMIVEGVYVSSEKLSPSVFLRSSRILSVRAQVYAKFMACLEELNIGTKTLISSSQNAHVCGI